MKKNSALAIVSTILFAMMVAVNYLAVALPINGITPGEVSDSYPNLFAPAGFTFSIWGLIYTLLFGFTIYQWFLTKREEAAPYLSKVQTYFILSSAFNISWVFAWHYQIIPVSLLLIVGMLLSLGLLINRLREVRLEKWNYALVRLPFSIYFGWLTVATIANVTVLLVSLKWNGFGISEEIWTVAVLLIGAIIGILTALRNRDIPYALVLIWAYFGILSKHLSGNAFSGQYTGIIVTSIVCMALYAVSIMRVLALRRKNGISNQ